VKHELRLSDIGEGLEEAEIIAWMVAVGDEVSRDQPVVEIMTDKSNAELPAPAAGVVVEVSGAVGDMINVGELIAVIETSAASDVTPPPPAPTPEPAETKSTTPSAFAEAVKSESVDVPLSPASDAPPSSRPKASPSTRRFAAERGIDLTTIVGSGPGGRILLTDLDETADQPAATMRPPATPEAGPTVAATSAPARTPEPTPQAATTATAGTVEPLRGIRRAVAANMTRSWSEIPHIHAFDHVNAEELLDLRARLKATGRPNYERLTALSFFVAAVARALRAHPTANASIDMTAETITYHPDVNVGIAVAAPQGLVVPVLHRADQLDFESLSAALAALVTGARDGSLDREQYRSGTVTITNFGALGGEQAVPLIRPPESLIVGFGSIADRPFVVDGEVVACKTMHIVAGADHRLLDGDTTTAVLSDIAESLVDPLRLVV